MMMENKNELRYYKWRYPVCVGHIAYKWRSPVCVGHPAYKWRSPECVGQCVYILILIFLLLNSLKAK